jgi:hypothetical protein
MPTTISSKVLMAWPCNSQTPTVCLDAACEMFLLCLLGSHVDSAQWCEQGESTHETAFAM